MFQSVYEAFGNNISEYVCTEHFITFSSIPGQPELTTSRTQFRPLKTHGKNNGIGIRTFTRRDQAIGLRQEGIQLHSTSGETIP